MQHFSEKATGRRTGGNSNPNSLKDLLRDQKTMLTLFQFYIFIRNFRMRENDFKFYPDIDIYTEFEIDKVIFLRAMNLL